MFSCHFPQNFNQLWWEVIRICWSVRFFRVLMASKKKTNFNVISLRREIFIKCKYEDYKNPKTNLKFGFLSRSDNYKRLF